MRRREVMVLLAGVAVGWPSIGTLAQDAAKSARRIGLLSGVPLSLATRAAFERGLREHNWTVNRDIIIEYRSADGFLDRLPDLALDLIRAKVELIVAVSAPETRAAKLATTTLPIIFAVHGNPVGMGDVESLAHPGGRLTGFSQMHPELSSKQLELLRECIPLIAKVTVLWNSTVAAKARDWEELKEASKAFSITLESCEIHSPADVSDALATIPLHRPDALLVLGDPLTVTVRETIVKFALSHRLPGMYPHRQFASAGGLLSYGADVDDLFRRAAGHVGKVLKGANPGDIPVEQPTKFEMAVNMRTAKVLGLEVPSSLLVRADMVIE